MNHDDRQRVRELLGAAGQVDQEDQTFLEQPDILKGMVERLDQSLAGAYSAADLAVWSTSCYGCATHYVITGPTSRKPHHCPLCGSPTQFRVEQR